MFQSYSSGKKSAKLYSKHTIAWPADGRAEPSLNHRQPSAPCMKIQRLNLWFCFFQGMFQDTHHIRQVSASSKKWCVCDNNISLKPPPTVHMYMYMHNLNIIYIYMIGTCCHAPLPLFFPPRHSWNLCDLLIRSNWPAELFLLLCKYGSMMVRHWRWSYTTQSWLSCVGQKVSWWPIHN